MINEIMEGLGHDQRDLEDVADPIYALFIAGRLSVAGADGGSGIAAIMRLDQAER